MMLTTKQALKFVAIAGKGQSKVYFETLLGDDEMPSVKDFSTDDADGHERAGCLLDCLQTIIDELTEHLRCQPKQLDFTKPQTTTSSTAATVSATKKTPAKKKKANANKTPAKKGKGKTPAKKKGKK